MSKYSFHYCKLSSTLVAELKIFDKDSSRITELNPSHIYKSQFDNNLQKREEAERNIPMYWAVIYLLHCKVTWAQQ